MGEPSGRERSGPGLHGCDGQGCRLMLPVSARGLSAFESEAGQMSVKGVGAKQASTTAPDKRAGLWVGTAVINKVAFAADPSPSNRSVPKPAASEFAMRLIIHVDASGQSRLLQQVTLMWKNGVTDAATGEVVEPGRYVILTGDDPGLVSKFSGAAVRDNKSVGRRISTAAFAFGEPKAMTGAFDDSLRCENITLGYDDPLNPFKHKYHPDHDNLSGNFETLLSEGTESYTINRTVDMVFTAEDPESLDLAGWGDNQVGGIYKERLEGVHKEYLYAEGTFRLHHVSRIPVLNDGE